ncbi:MAG: hypothetical protein EPN24_02000 [Candidatus Methanoperedens sp.]|nr:MAG: hypothetical protein EPN24_02000 [Candidatus Methanoperedens sp.]
MEKVKAVIEEVSIHKIYDLFSSKPGGLKFNDTDAIVVTAKTQDGNRITHTFYFCLKPDGTFNQETISRDGSRARRQRLVSFLKYYGIAGNVKEYNIKERIGEWKGKTIEVLPSEKDGSIYIP